MASDPKLPLNPNVIPFEKFWSWLQVHPNCILGAGTPEVALFDDDEFVESISYRETRGYVKRVLQNRRIYHALYEPFAASPAPNG